MIPHRSVSPVTRNRDTLFPVTVAIIRSMQTCSQLLDEITVLSFCDWMSQFGWGGLTQEPAENLQRTSQWNSLFQPQFLPFLSATTQKQWEMTTVWRFHHQPTLPILVPDLGAPRCVLNPGPQRSLVLTVLRTPSPCIPSPFPCISLHSPRGTCFPAGGCAKLFGNTRPKSGDVGPNVT